MDTLSLDVLKNAVAGAYAAVRRVTRLEPLGDKVFPPTYEGGEYADEARQVRAENGDVRPVATVLLDSVQFERQSWQQRNRIKTPSGLQWLTVPVVFHGHFGQKILEVEIRDPAFCRKHLRAIELNYRRTPFFQEYFPEFAEILQEWSGSRLLQLNQLLI